MDQATLTNDEIAEIFHAARAEVGDALDYADQVNRLVQERVSRAIELKELRRRVALEMESKLW